MGNITVKIDEELVRKAKILAARRGTSVSRLVAEQLDALVQRDERFQIARERARRRLAKGYDLGWTPPAGRDELHER